MAAFREVFRNRAATEWAPIVLLATFSRLAIGLVFASLLLISVGFFLLGLLHVLLAVDPFGMKIAFAEIPAGAKGIIALLVGLLFTGAFFGTMMYFSLRDVRSRLHARRYVSSGKLLHFVEGMPAFDEGSESGFLGLEIGDFYFSFADCWIDLDFGELAKLKLAGAHWRVWYIPTGLRTWKNPATGKIVQYGAILVRAEASS